MPQTPQDPPFMPGSIGTGISSSAPGAELYSYAQNNCSVKMAKFVGTRQSVTIISLHFFRCCSRNNTNRL